MSNLPAVNKLETIRELLEKQKGQMSLVLPRHVTPDRMARIAMTSIRKNPALLECSPMSLVAAVMECAQLGLVPDGILGHAHLVPFGTDVVVIIGYKGYIWLAMQTGRVTAVCPNVVRDGDELDYRPGTDRCLHHVPKRDNDGEIIAFYNVILFANGQVDFRLLWKSEVDKIRAGAPGSKRSGGPWDTYYVPMGMKTAIRQHVKYLSLSPEADRAASLDEMADASVPQDLDLMHDVLDVTPEERAASQREQLGKDLQKATESRVEPEDEGEKGDPFETAKELFKAEWHKAKGTANKGEMSAEGQKYFEAELANIAGNQGLSFVMAEDSAERREVADTLAQWIIAGDYKLTE